MQRPVLAVSAVAFEHHAAVVFEHKEGSVGVMGDRVQWADPVSVVVYMDDDDISVARRLLSNGGCGIAESFLDKLAPFIHFLVDGLLGSRRRGRAP